MKRLTSTIAGLMLLSAGCFLFTKTPITPTAPDGGFPDASAGTKFVDCSKTALHDTELRILPAVETALALQDYELELAKLVGQYGLDEVACAVHYVIDKASGQAAKTGDPIEFTKANSGRAWLAKQAVTFKGGAQ